MKSSQPLIPPVIVNPGWRIAIVHSSYYPEEVSQLVEAARKTLEDAGIPRTNISVHPVAGSFEIPLIGAALLEAKGADALIGLGVIVEGETHHADLIARAVSRGIMDVQIRYRKPFSFEVLYVDSIDQARARSGTDGNRGAEAARGVLHSLAQLHALCLDGL